MEGKRVIGIGRERKKRKQKKKRYFLLGPKRDSSKGVYCDHGAEYGEEDACLSLWKDQEIRRAGERESGRWSGLRFSLAKAKERPTHQKNPQSRMAGFKKSRGSPRRLLVLSP